MSSQGLCWTVQGSGGTFDISLQELWEQIKLEEKKEFNLMTGLNSAYLIEKYFKE